MDKYIRVKNCNCISDATIDIVTGQDTRSVARNGR